MCAEGAAQHLVEHGALPIAGNEMIMSGGHGAQPAFEMLDELFDADAGPRRVARDGLDHRERILDSVIELSEKQRLTPLPALSLADIAGNLRCADNSASSIADR